MTNTHPTAPAASSSASESASGEQLLVPRRRPAQARSKQRYERILKAAREVLVDVGFESFTFDEVAKRAEVPIGTLYQFFANKYVLICELDRQDTAASVTELERFSQQVPALQWPDVLSEFIDHLATLWREDPSRRAVWHAVQSTPATRYTARHTEKAMIDLLVEILAPLNPYAPEEVRRRLAAFLLHTGSSQLNFAVRDLDQGPEYFDGVVEEIKRMIVAYLFAVAAA